jgi:hypothetical protein
MVWVGLLKAVLSIAGSVAAYIKDKQLMDAGAAKAVLAGIQEAEKEVARAEKIRSDYRDAIAADPDKLRTPDKHERK